ncbi:hypothetical protein [Phycicoccus jejuensis]|uniref:hypothetical protein n=1 Tax=Phycicoccus jejuensis TaxID=367299 RepID=UPI000AE42F44|nr:hypothetical protein [Phycicoccus jejuensis]
MGRGRAARARARGRRRAGAGRHPSAAALAPSLHLNLGDGYRRQGRITEARRELEAAETTAHLLGDDGYGELLRGGIERLRARLDAGDH